MNWYNINWHNVDWEDAEEVIELFENFDAEDVLLRMPFPNKLFENEEFCRRILEINPEIISQCIPMKMFENEKFAKWATEVAGVNLIIRRNIMDEDSKKGLINIIRSVDNIDLLYQIDSTLGDIIHELYLNDLDSDIRSEIDNKQMELEGHNYGKAIQRYVEEMEIQPEEVGETIYYENVQEKKLQKIGYNIENFDEFVKYAESIGCDLEDANLSEITEIYDEYISIDNYTPQKINSGINPKRSDITEVENEMIKKIQEIEDPNKENNEEHDDA